MCKYIKSQEVKQFFLIVKEIFELYKEYCLYVLKL